MTPSYMRDLFYEGERGIQSFCKIRRASAPQLHLPTADKGDGGGRGSQGKQFTGRTETLFLGLIRNFKESNAQDEDTEGMGGHRWGWDSAREGDEGRRP